MFACRRVTSGFRVWSRSRGYRGAHHHDQGSLMRSVHLHKGGCSFPADVFAGALGDKCRLDLRTGEIESRSTRMVSGCQVRHLDPLGGVQRTRGCRRGGHRRVGHGTQEDPDRQVRRSATMSQTAWASCASSCVVMQVNLVRYSNRHAQVSTRSHSSRVRLSILVRCGFQ